MSVVAVLWDFGGVISASPFEAFARYEASRGLPAGFLRGLNATNPDHNAWARLERGDLTVDQFDEAYRVEAREHGYDVDPAAVLALLHGAIRPEMVEAILRCRKRLKTALLTNNVGQGGGPRSDGVKLDELFDVVIESSRAGCRKPDPRFYELACHALAIDPTEAVFLDDLGINLKPARAMGMRTIKVVEPEAALAELEEVLGFSVR